MSGKNSSGMNSSSLGRLWKIGSTGLGVGGGALTPEARIGAGGAEVSSASATGFEVAASPVATGGGSTVALVSTLATSASSAAPAAPGATFTSTPSLHDFSGAFTSFTVGSPPVLFPPATASSSFGAESTAAASAGRSCNGASGTGAFGASRTCTGDTSRTCACGASMICACTSRTCVCDPSPSPDVTPSIATAFASTSTSIVNGSCAGASPAASDSTSGGSATFAAAHSEVSDVQPQGFEEDSAVAAAGAEFAEAGGGALGAGGAVPHASGAASEGVSSCVVTASAATGTFSCDAEAGLIGAGDSAVGGEAVAGVSLEDAGVVLAFGTGDGLSSNLEATIFGSTNTEALDSMNLVLGGATIFGSSSLTRDKGSLWCSPHPSSIYPRLDEEGMWLGSVKHG
ncbi:hypothetical protein C8F04DRAFT_1146336 [Mycena alexandri]|uniref:Uncharacterized protein n=1 Tax=Mycena alexandri TaxID=1745969 RepID=A0AAD6S270_9AGAR|nr:hypothetical protein C8F04DRAFT_1146336 [Mycena alexandri]